MDPLSIYYESITRKHPMARHMESYKNIMFITCVIHGFICQCRIPNRMQMDTHGMDANGYIDPYHRISKLMDP